MESKAFTSHEAGLIQLNTKFGATRDLFSKLSNFLSPKDLQVVASVKNTVNSDGNLVLEIGNVIFDLEMDMLQLTIAEDRKHVLLQALKRLEYLETLKLNYLANHNLANIDVQFRNVFGTGTAKSLQNSVESFKKIWNLA